MSIEGAPCTVCNAGKLVAKQGHATGSFAGQTYYVCGNWQFHNEHKDKSDPLKSPWILASDTAKIEKYLAAAAGEPVKRPATGTLNFAAAKKAKPAAASVDPTHIAVTTAAKIAHLESRLEYLISLIEPKNSNEQTNNDEPAEDE